MNFDLFDFEVPSYWDLRPTRSFTGTDNSWTVNVRIEDVTAESLKCEPNEEPERIVFNGPATIAFWPDGTKTVVKCQDGEPFDPEKGVALAMLKKYFRGAKYNDVLNKLIKNATYETKK